MATATHRRSGRKRGPAKTVAIVASAVVLAASGIGYAAASEVTGQVKHVTVFDGMSGRVPNDGGQNIRWWARTIAPAFRRPNARSCTLASPTTGAIPTQ